MSSPDYFETSWSIMSSVGLFAFLMSTLVMAITRPSPLIAVPIVVSVAAAMANGLCFYAFYMNYPIRNRIAASVFADIFWLVSLQSAFPLLVCAWRFDSKPNKRYKRPASRSTVTKS